MMPHILPPTLDKTSWVSEAGLSSAPQQVKQVARSDGGVSKTEYITDAVPVTVGTGPALKPGQNFTPADLKEATRVLEDLMKHSSRSYGMPAAPASAEAFIEMVYSYMLQRTVTNAYANQSIQMASSMATDTLNLEKAAASHIMKAAIVEGISTAAVDVVSFGTQAWSGRKEVGVETSQNQLRAFSARTDQLRTNVNNAQAHEQACILRANGGQTPEVVQAQAATLNARRAFTAHVTGDLRPVPASGASAVDTTRERIQNARRVNGHGRTAELDYNELDQAYQSDHQSVSDQFADAAYKWKTTGIGAQSAGQPLSKLAGGLARGNEETLQACTNSDARLHGTYKDILFSINQNQSKEQEADNTGAQQAIEALNKLSLQTTQTQSTIISKI